MSCRGSDLRGEPGEPTSPPSAHPTRAHRASTIETGGNQPPTEPQPQRWVRSARRCRDCDQPGRDLQEPPAADRPSGIARQIAANDLPATIVTNRRPPTRSSASIRRSGRSSVESAAAPNNTAQAPSTIATSAEAERMSSVATARGSVASASCRGTRRSTSIESNPGPLNDLGERTSWSALSRQARAHWPFRHRVATGRGPAGAWRCRRSQSGSRAWETSDYRHGAHT